MNFCADPISYYFPQAQGKLFVTQYDLEEYKYRNVLGEKFSAIA